MTRFAYNYVELAKALSISRSGLKRFAQVPNHPEPKSDGRHDVKAWARFISANASRIGTGTPTLPLSAKDLTRIKLMELQIEREAVKLDRERHDLLREVGTIVSCWIDRLRTRLEKLVSTELPPVLHMREAREIAPVARSKFRDTYNGYIKELKADLRQCERAHAK
jgi:hypothetical protein